MRKTPSLSAPPKACPCGGKDYASCCQPLHNGIFVPNAERLMRSRYSAYVLNLEPYLLATWHPCTRPASIEMENDMRWFRLEVRHFEENGDQAIVEFVARYKVAGRAFRMHERSQFERLEGRWYYLDGEVENV